MIIIRRDDAELNRCFGYYCFVVEEMLHVLRILSRWNQMNTL